MTENEKREAVTTSKEIKVRRSGTSDVLTVPAEWLKTIKALQARPLIFDAKIERDGKGHLFLVAEMVKSEKPKITS